MSNINKTNNGKLGSGTNTSEAIQPGRCPTGEQGGPGRQHATASVIGREGGDTQGNIRGVRKSGIIGKKAKTRKEGKRGKFKEKWTDEERRVLWECFARSGGKRSGGYIKKVKEMWDGRDLSLRGVPSLLSQLKQIESNNLLTVMERRG